jgi:dihydroxy-acid dehydratase
VLHLLAMAREAELPLTIDDFEPVLARTPVFVDIKPGGKYMAADVDQAGGIGVIAQRLLEGGYVDGSARTVTGRSFSEEAAKARETAGQFIGRLARPSSAADAIARIARAKANIKLAGT